MCHNGEMNNGANDCRGRLWRLYQIMLMILCRDERLCSELLDDAIEVFSDGGEEGRSGSQGVEVKSSQRYSFHVT